MIGKAYLIVLIFIIIFLIIPNQSTAMGDIFNSADNFTKVNSANFVDQETIKDVSDTIFNVFLTIGIFVAVGIASVLGIKFMIGSVEAQAKVKESLLPFVVGCVLIFGAFGIWKLIISIGEKLLE